MTKHHAQCVFNTAKENMYLKLFYVLLYAFQTVLKTSDHLGSHSATPHKLKCALRVKLYEHYAKNSNISNHKTFV